MNEDESQLMRSTVPVLNSNVINMWVMCVSTAKPPTNIILPTDMGSVIKCNLLAQPVAAGLHTHTHTHASPCKVSECVCVCVTVTVNLDAEPKTTTTTINTQTTHIKNERKKRTASTKATCAHTHTHTDRHTHILRTSVYSVGCITIVIWVKAIHSPAKQSETKK